MNNSKYLTLFILFIFSSGCFNLVRSEKNNEVIQKIKNDIPALSSCVGIFNVVYCDYNQNWISTDDIYILEGIGEIHYGYDLNKIKFNIYQEGNEKILRVTIPEIEEIARKWKVDNIYRTHRNYNPQNNDPNKEINKDLDSRSKQYLQRANKFGKETIKFYFTNIAEIYGLTLDLVFEDEKKLPLQIPPPELK